MESRNEGVRMAGVVNVGPVRATYARTNLSLVNHSFRRWIRRPRRTGVACAGLVISLNLTCVSPPCRFFLTRCGRNWSEKCRPRRRGGAIKHATYRTLFGKPRQPGQLAPICCDQAVSVSFEQCCSDVIGRRACWASFWYSCVRFSHEKWLVFATVDYSA